MFRYHRHTVGTKRHKSHLIEFHLQIQNMKPSGIWKQIIRTLLRTFTVYCTLLFWFMSYYRKITRSFAQSQKTVYLFILNNISSIFHLKSVLSFFKNKCQLVWNFATILIHFEMCQNTFYGHCNSTEYEWQPMKASLHMFILRKKKKKKDCSQVFAVHVNTAQCLQRPHTPGLSRCLPHKLWDSLFFNADNVQICLTLGVSPRASFKKQHVQRCAFNSFFNMTPIFHGNTANRFVLYM